VHAASTRFKPSETFSAEALRSGGLFYAVAANGGKTLTDKRLSLYAAWFENAVKNAPQLPVFRFAGQGLGLKGVNLCSPDALLALPIIKSEIDESLAGLSAAIDRDFYAEEQVRERALRFEAAAEKFEP
jgi:hypothetical protein